MCSWGCILAHGKGFIKGSSKHLPWPMGIGEGKGGFLRGILYPQMPELTQAGG